TASGQRVLSVTNSAGVFYLEGMTQGAYRFEIGDRSVEKTILHFDETAELFQEINFKVQTETIETQTPR
ncbi:MAG: hypothetical protein AAFY17_17565, partial [Cyanobacteria bacterium J06642_11]